MDPVKNYCANMAPTAYNTEEADFKLEIKEEVIIEENVKTETIKDENVTANCSVFSVKEEQTLETSMEDVFVGQALEVYCDKVCDKNCKCGCNLRRIVLELEKLSCNYCEYVTESTNDYTSHVETAHADKKTERCKHCKKTFFDRAALKVHLFTHTVSKIYACKFCDKTFIELATLRGHCRFIHNIDDKSCYFCDFLPESKIEMSAHMRQEHADKIPWVCKACNKSYYTLSNLKIHLLIHKDICHVSVHKLYNKSKMMVYYKSPVGKRQFSCSKCYKKYSSFCHLRNHMDSHKWDDSSTSEHENLSKFVPRITLDSFVSNRFAQKTTSTYECEICDYKSLKKCNLAKHMNKHNGKPFQCTNCNRGFTWYETLKVHVANKSCKLQKANPKYRKQTRTKYPETQRIYACKVCDKSFRLRSQIRQHTKIEHKINDMSCFFCDYVPASSKDLPNHLEKEHADKKTISCEQCDKTFFDSIHLRTHLAVHVTMKKPIV